MARCSVHLPLDELGRWSGQDFVCCIESDQQGDSSKQYQAIIHPRKHVRVILLQKGWVRNTKYEKLADVAVWCQQPPEKKTVRLDLRENEGGLRNNYYVEVTVVVDHLLIGCATAKYFNDPTKRLQVVPTAPPAAQPQHNPSSTSPSTAASSSSPRHSLSKSEREIQRLNFLLQEKDLRICQLEEELKIYKLKAQVANLTKPTSETAPAPSLQARTSAAIKEQGQVPASSPAAEQASSLQALQRPQPAAVAAQEQPRRGWFSWFRSSPAQTAAPMTTPSTASQTSGMSVYFVLGGPGAGKGTQCSLLSKKYPFTHLSAGDLLRAERKNPNSKEGALIEHYIQEGKIVPVEITVNLLKKAMVTSGSKKFLIDGFPRNQNNLDGWLKYMGDVEIEFVLFYDCPMETCMQRALGRGGGRSDDNVESYKKRYNTFLKETMPIVEHFRSKGMVRTVSSLPPIHDVFLDTCKHFD